MIFYTIYTSQPRSKITRELLDEVTSVSVENNKKKNVTGMLLGLENKFIQYLEGDEEEVKSLFETIRKDARHHDVYQWVSGFAESRVFSEWSMGSWLLSNEEMSALPALEDISTFLGETGSSHQSSRFLQMMKDLLETWLMHEPERANRMKQ
ncbi:MAG: hypothetical protein Tsb0034_22480 [Ekhidna sp.]